MFDTPSYRSYIALCRELRLEREFEEGDHFGFAHPGHPTIGVEMCGHYEPYKSSPTEWPERHLENWWLPRLDQWVMKLREVGGLRNLRLYFPVTIEDDFVGKAYFADDRTFEGRSRDNVEEACARLWCAVAGRTVGD